MKKIFLILLFISISAISFANILESDTIIVSRLETTYKARLSYNPKNIVNIVYCFENNSDCYEVVAYMQQTLIQRGMVPTTRYEVKKALKNDKRINVKTIEVIPNPFENNHKIILIYK